MEVLPLPDELAPGAAVVQVTASTLCGSDAELWRGDMGWPGMLPIVLGHEIVGRIVALGADARDATGAELAVGDRIGWSEAVCGQCYACTVLHEPVACVHRRYGMRQRADVAPYVIGGLSEFTVVTPGAQKLRIVDGLDDRLVAAAGCALKTVVHAYERAGGMGQGDCVVIQGAGALGLFAAALARVNGASTVVVIGGPADRLELAARFGADVALPLSMAPEERIATVTELTGGRGADLVMDLAGAPDVADEAVRMAAQNGRYVIVGTTSDRPATIPLGMVMRKQLRILGCVNGDFRHYHQAVGVLNRHRDTVPWLDVFAAPRPLDEAGDALAALSAQTAIKPVIDPRLPAAPALATRQEHQE